MIILPSKPYESFLDAIESQRELCEYIFDLTEEPGMELYPHRFWYRYGAGKIDAPFSKESFMENREIVDTLKGYGIDLEKFWCVLLFIYDWTECQFSKCLDMVSHSHGMLLEELLAKLGGDWVDVTIHIRKGRKNLALHPMLQHDMLAALQHKLEELKRKGADNLIVYRSKEYGENHITPSYRIYFATEKLQTLFSLLEQWGKIATPKRKKSASVSYNKMLLFSRIIYFYRFTNNCDYVSDDDNLKAVMKDYKGRIPQTISSVYNEGL